MPSTLQQVIPYLLIPVVATIAGAVVAAFYTPGPTVRSSIQHFAAGVVFAALSRLLSYFPYACFIDTGSFRS